MPNYIKVEAISTETGVSFSKIYEKCRILGIDTKKITENRKKKILEALQPTIDRKNGANDFLETMKSVKVAKSEEILLISGSTLEQRLSIAKREFDKVNQSLIECQIAIDTHGTIIQNVNGTISSNPAVKTKCELLKQQTSLQKTIQELEDRLKMATLSTSNETKINTIDDE